MSKIIKEDGVRTKEKVNGKTLYLTQFYNLDETAGTDLGLTPKEIVSIEKSVFHFLSWQAEIKKRIEERG